jgi:amino acid transporter
MLLAYCLGGMSVVIFFDQTNDKYIAFKVNRETRMVLAFVAMLFLYIYSMSIIGFEISSFVFLSLTMLLLGLRKVPVILGIATILPALVYGIFVKMMFIPIPSLFQGL